MFCAWGVATARCAGPAGFGIIVAGTVCWVGFGWRFVFAQFAAEFCAGFVGLIIWLVVRLDVGLDIRLVGRVIFWGIFGIGD